MSDVFYGLVDIGGTKVLVGIANSYSQMLGTVRFDTEPSSSPDVIVKRVAEALYGLLDQQQLPIDVMIAVGVSVPGPLNRELGIVHFTGNLGWKNFPFAAALSKELEGKPVFLDDDGNCAGIGEAYYGAGKGYKNQIYITVSTGIGGCIMTNGQIHRGHQDLAGEIGHMTIMPDGPACTCGNLGCPEALASGTAIARLGQQAVLQDRSPYLSELEGTLSSKQVLEGAQHGDEACQQIVEQVSLYLGIASANLVQLLNPEVIIFGGGVMEQAVLLLPHMTREMNRHLFAVQRHNVILHAASLGDKSALWGALHLVKDSMNYTGVSKTNHLHTTK